MHFINTSEAKVVDFIHCEWNGCEKKAVKEVSTLKGSFNLCEEHYILFLEKTKRS